MPQGNSGHRDDTLQRLQLLRVITLLLQLLAIAALHRAAELPAPSASLTVLLLSAFSIPAGRWLVSQRWRQGQRQVALQLTFELLAASSLLYLNGGASNPAISYLLVPIAIAATLLERQWVALITTLALSCSTVLLVWYHPLPLLMPSHHQHSGGGLNLHIIGMWLNLSVSALLLTYLVTQMAHLLRQREREIANLREGQLRNEQLLAVATLAANTAHELGTPLNTLWLLSEAIEEELDPADRQLLQQQLQLCRQALQQLKQAGDQQRWQQRETLPVDRWLEGALQHWQLLRPEARYQLQRPDQSAPLIEVAPTLEQALINLLNNAWEANTEATDALQIQLHWAEGRVDLELRDFGSGVAPQTPTLGQSDKHGGLGLGLFLSHATIEQHGGSLQLIEANPGTRTLLQLPCHPSTAEGHA